MITETVATPKEKTMPFVWSENQKEIQFEELKTGFLVKIDCFSLPQGFDTEVIGIYRGLKEAKYVQGEKCLEECLILEIAGDRYRANTAGHMCESKLKEIILPWVHNITILARDFHAVFELFHALGVCEVRLKNAQQRIEQAQSCLKDKSGLNLIGP